MCLSRLLEQHTPLLSYGKKSCLVWSKALVDTDKPDLVKSDFH